MTRLLLILAALALLCMPALAHDDDAPTACADHTLAVGFYAFFEPVSYNASDDPDSDEFHKHLGYESDLLSAMEAMAGAGLTFTRSAIPTWAGIWLRSASHDYDIVLGGITNLDTRRYDKDGVEQIAFTSSHLTFRHSLLTRAEAAERLDSYAALTSDDRVGVVPSTTGESRLLEITGLTDADGVLLAGVTVETPAGALTADGSADYVITAADESDGLEGRTRLLPPGRVQATGRLSGRGVGRSRADRRAEGWRDRRYRARANWQWAGGLRIGRRIGHQRAGRGGGIWRAEHGCGRGRLARVPE